MENMNETKRIRSVEKIQISIAKSNDIETWSSGEVTKPETINYKTHKPEKMGLFDEKIFGPIKDFRCPVCGKKHKGADSGKLCSSCGEGMIESKLVRRRKMGHIKLGAPISHIWFSKVDYSAIRSILGIKQDELDSVIYFRSHIIYDNGGFASIKNRQIIPIQTAPSIYRKILKTIEKAESNKETKKIIQEKIEKLELDSSSEIGQNYGIDFYEYNYFISKYSGIKIGTGAGTIKEILGNLNLKLEQRKIKKDLIKNPAINANFRRNKVVESFIISKQNPADMIFDVLPIIPADLRPLIQLDGGRHATVDINELYRRVIIRNNRLKQWLRIGAPDLIVQNEKRMLQESVDALFDNERRKVPVQSKDGRPLKSLAENLKGKQGRFRQNLLGKRVDYSGRSVIVVGPELKLNQVGLPKQMVVKLFEPFIVNLLVEEQIAKNIKHAKKMIEMLDDKIWKYADRVIKNHPVFLNRAPTLHRLSIQAFEPVITSGKAIRLHPLVTTAFNADFDGDQMAVHVPLSKKAKRETIELVLSTKNILGPKDGKLIVAPGQDIVLGTYYLTKSNDVKEPRIYLTMNNIHNDLTMNRVGINDIIVISLKLFKEKFIEDIKQGYKYVVTTAGRLLLNEILPSSFVYINQISKEDFKALPSIYLSKTAMEISKIIKEVSSKFKPFNKADISSLIELVFERNPEEIVIVLEAIKELGFEYSMKSGVSMGILDIVEIEDRDRIISEGDAQVAKYHSYLEDGLITDDQRYLGVLKIWQNVREQIQVKLSETLSSLPDNPLFMMMDSGARGNISNFVQLAGLRGSMAKATHEYAALTRQGILVRSIEEIPIKSSFKIGLTPFEYFLSTHGARKGLSDTATKTAESGYLTRRLVDAVQDVMIIENNCGTNSGVKIKTIVDTKTSAIIEPLKERIWGRYAAKDIKKGNKILVKNGELITKQMAHEIELNEIKEVEIRSILTCNSRRGICGKCYGLDLTTLKEINIGEAVGIISAQSIGEPGTQLTMRTFHTGGVTGVADITQGFTRLMELLDANINPKNQAIISTVGGKVHSIESFTENKYGQVLQYKVTIKSVKNIKDFIVDARARLRVKEGEIVKPGSKITEGAIKLQELLEVAGSRATQSYLIKEIQKLYRLQGIEISDKYIEVIIRQMLSKFQIIEPGNSNLYTSQIVSQNQLREINQKLIKHNKQPAYGRQIILGVKPLPLQSESFLAAASYQRTAEALVNASISKKIDNLYGVKESLIVGNKIPVGTGMKVQYGKYDIIESIDKNLFEDEYYEIQDSKDAEANKKHKKPDEIQEEIRIVNELNNFE